MKKRIVFVLLVLLIVSAIIPAFAHSGRTDSDGGHTDKSTGEYHYHHGYSAHQHTNGECPYDFDDKTDHSSSSTSYTKTSLLDEFKASKTYEDGYDKGYDVGHEVGRNKGYLQGEKAGYDKGYADGKPSVPGWCFVVFVIAGIVILIIYFCYVDNIKRTRRTEKSLQQDILKLKEINATLEHSNEDLTKQLAFQDQYVRKIKNIANGLASEAEEETLKLLLNNIFTGKLQIPDNIYFLDDLTPVSGAVSKEKPYGDLTAYVSTNGSRYHLNSSCCSGYYKGVHMFKVIGRFSPCKKCVKKALTEVPDWYKDFESFVNKK